VFARVSVANLYEVYVLDEVVFEPGAFYVVDRGYTDFRRLKHIDSSGAYFVIRAKKSLRFSRLVSRAVDKARGVLVDQTIRLLIARSVEGYPDQLRRITFLDAENDRRFIYLTNNFLLDAAVIAEVYRSRWKIELFFKWIKQHLRIKAFYGTTPNAVNTQIWIALSVFVLVAIVKKELKIDKPLYTILQILSITLFEKEPISQVLTTFERKIQHCPPRNQLNSSD
jgi:IS4 transposase